MISFETFMRLALYDREVGYYRRPTRRVGYAAGTDFFTSTTSGPVFGELVCASAVKLLGSRSAAEHTFVEIGAEPGSGVLTGVAHPFAAVRTLRLEDPLELTGGCVVFSNELLDAQPFRRFRVREGRWRELGVVLCEGLLAETEVGDAPSDLAAVLPSQAPEGYVFDAPLAAARLAGDIAAQSWTGLFLACDYGKSLAELAQATPAGTARAYHRHTQSNDLLARPGEQDLTCHVCWDWIADSLNRHGFQGVRIDSQESYFIRNAESYLAPAIAADAARFTPRKQALLQLLHGSHLGHKFQVLQGLR